MITELPHIIGLEVHAAATGRPIRGFCLDHLHMITERDGPSIWPVWSGTLVTDGMPCWVCKRTLGAVAQTRAGSA